jgi:hypothetical protein
LFPSPDQNIFLLSLVTESFRVSDSPIQSDDDKMSRLLLTDRDVCRLSEIGNECELSNLSEMDGER